MKKSSLRWIFSNSGNGLLSSLRGLTNSITVYTDVDGAKARIKKSFY